jgi:hypothetical protein
MKRSLLLCMTLALGALFASDEHTQKPITVTGTVVDTGCYVAHDSSGSDHVKCATQCARKGIPLAIVDASGKLYSIVAVDHQNPNLRLMPFIEKKVEVTGTLFEKGGASGIWIKSVTTAK